MKHHFSLDAGAVLLTAGLLIQGNVLAADPMVDFSAQGQQASWTPNIRSHYHHLELSVETPDGEVDTWDFPSGSDVWYQADAGDGSYQWEIKSMPMPLVVSNGKPLDGPLDANGRPEALTRQINLPTQVAGASESGSFTVSNGVIADPTLVE